MAEIHHTIETVDSEGSGWNAGMMAGLAIGLILLIAVAFLVIARPWSGGGLVDTNGPAPQAPIQRTDDNRTTAPGTNNSAPAPAQAPANNTNSNNSITIPNPVNNAAPTGR